MKWTLTIRPWHLVAAPFAAVGAALLVGGSGLVSVAANTGHFAPVEWFLHWTLQRAVDTQSLPISKPDDVSLDDPLLVQRVAGHFASGCAPCHGAPGELQTPVARAMMPPVPRLETQVGEWRDRELFWIGRHGIKYSGMPSWSTQDRPDEVWALVAFLRALPDMSPERYRELAYGQPSAEPGRPGLQALGQAGDTALADCARCHGEDGRGVGPAGSFPPIGGQSEEYLFRTLQAFSSGTRQSGIMTPAAGIHDEATLRRLAAHYAAQAPIPAPVGPLGPPAGVAIGYEGAVRLPRGSIGPDAPTDEPVPTGAAAAVDPSAAHGYPVSTSGLMELGRRIAEEGLPRQKLAACQTCHGADAAATNPLYPRLDGLPEWYTATHLQMWKDRHRGGTPLAHVMETIAINLTEEQIDALALWYSRRGD
ncbi:c-type cytochrome [Aureimonas sp. Leaf324]|jgi:cytochrome c553|uniref:c-type cytochrome n=1 Tax=Aureimonas sp. Leaf324 TaxID=1736336 RepID=UPI0006FCDC4A|nr:c-type cytochrome [Aureimonas sp. Leaf324]KQQ90339.1 hypothetical protein ASF65_15975 [Aureimonas sp. Leaf324]